MTTSTGAAGSPTAQTHRAGGRVPSARPSVHVIGPDAELAIRRLNFSKERKVSLLSVELSRERIREHERKIEDLSAIARVRAMRRARRDAHARALRVRRILFIR
ncbi:hypothetical protein [Actinomadura sp. HBU206391]|uniref:hypothetical protein n=1 Tax=Actinomadura sp. HBU206391 TaxID=2731692 RepID=UPI0016505B5C|nr:hypothetical protein [Actinomadura sp. HBU206391]MBC6462409.1 hypothetical protein [Actinomadura sp. HBU206391]